MKNKLHFIALFFIIFFHLCCGSAKVNEKTVFNIDLTRFETMLIKNAIPFDEKEFIDPLLEKVGDSRYVLLGEASHGTSEYYKTRSLITTELILKKNFSLIALEADWADVYEINQYIKGKKYKDLDTRELLKRTFTRWPQWMWANEEFAGLIDWLKDHNERVKDSEKIGIYGMDLYGINGSISELLGYVGGIDEKLASSIESLYEILIHFSNDMQEYSRYVHNTGKNSEKDAEKVLSMLKKDKRTLVSGSSEKDYFNAIRNATVVRNAERHYRAMLNRDETGWNIRVEHFKDTVEDKMNFYKDKKIIVWAHNTHVGDARATDMILRNRKNIGKLLKQKYANMVFITGFGSFKGTVLAGRQWGSPMRTMIQPASPEGSLEYILNSALDGRNAIFLFDDEIRRYNDKYHPHRAIGVVYNPENERWGNYVATYLSKRYDAFIFINTTSALNALQEE